MRVYYNDNCSMKCAILREMMADGLIAEGDIDSRSITDIDPADLDGYTRCHFFAGIGGWEIAMAMAGWPRDAEVWTGSCPCQPFSAIGERKGTDDDRHLWPAFQRLITERRPPVVFGEQVASQDGLGWLDGVWADLENAGYAFASFDLCAAGVGAPHIRQRLYWVGHAISKRLEGHDWDGDAGRRTQADRPDAAASGAGSLPPSVDAMPLLRRMDLHDPQGTRPRLRLSADRRVGDDALRPWERFDALPCGDGWRRVRPGSFPLADGVRPGRDDALRGAGDAIVPQVAAEFVIAYMEATGA